MPFDSEIGSVKLYSPSALGKPWRVTWTPPGMPRQVKDRDSSMTRNDATSKAGVIRETLGERYLDSLTERDIEEWRDTKLKGSKRYRNNILAHLRHLYERARVWGFVPKGHNPAREVPSMKIPRPEPVVWAPKTLKACLEWYRKSEKPDVGGKIVFLALGAFAGMRPSEIEGVVGERDGLQWDDIDFKQRHIRVRAEVAGKLAEPRYITLSRAEKRSRLASSEKRKASSFHAKCPVVIFSTTGACPRLMVTLRMFPGSFPSPLGKRSISGVPLYHALRLTCLVPCQSPRAM